MVGAGGTAAGSLAWLTSRYSERGVDFDEIFGWEATKHDPNVYWSHFPEVCPAIPEACQALSDGDDSVHQPCWRRCKGPHMG